MEFKESDAAAAVAATATTMSIDLELCNRPSDEKTTPDGRYLIQAIDQYDNP